MSGKGDKRRPEKDKGAYSQKYDQINWTKKREGFEPGKSRNIQGCK